MYRATPLTEKTALKELGERIRAHRIALNLSREAFAEKAGIGKNTLVRLEMGQSVSLSHLVKVLLQFGFAEALVDIVPDYSRSPMMLLRESQKLPQRQRAGRKKKNADTAPWVWKEDE
ncbi:MAG: helix-turn-helix transcriptional regulator [Fibrobacter sp.]|nr:helix-turn-helix transcriptional regulator [Fibrobacter sp.]